MCLTVAAISDIFTQDIEDLGTPYCPPESATTNSVSADPAQPQDEDFIDIPNKKTDTTIIDLIKRTSSRRLDNGSMKFGIETPNHQWFSSFNEEQ